MTTFYCAECAHYMSPFQTLAGTCFQCGGGTTRSNEEPNADAAYNKYMKAKVSADRHERFEEFYARRDRERPDAWKD